jgi:hypothetical protein
MHPVLPRTVPIYVCLNVHIAKTVDIKVVIFYLSYFVGSNVNFFVVEYSFLHI